MQKPHTRKTLTHNKATANKETVIESGAQRTMLENEIIHEEGCGQGVKQATCRWSVSLITQHSRQFGRKCSYGQNKSRAQSVFGPIY